MRGVTAYASDFYFGASPTMTSNEENADNAPASPTTTTALTTTPTPGTSFSPVQILPALQKINPLLAIPVLLGVWVLLKLLHEWGHKSGEFQKVRIDLWFALAATVSYLMLGPLVKAILQKYRLPAISDYVANA